MNKLAEIMQRITNELQQELKKATPDKVKQLRRDCLLIRMRRSAL